jgi:hypothetical protein
MKQVRIMWKAGVGYWVERMNGERISDNNHNHPHSGLAQVEAKEYGANLITFDPSTYDAPPPPYMLTAWRVTYDNGDVDEINMAFGVTYAEAKANFIGVRFEITETTFRTGVKVEQIVTPSFIFHHLTGKGWKGERLALGETHWESFTKEYETATGPKTAIIYNHDRKLTADYQSEGRNVLEGCFVLNVELKACTTKDVDQFLRIVEKRIDDSYARRLYLNANNK